MVTSLFRFRFVATFIDTSYVPHRSFARNQIVTFGKICSVTHARRPLFFGACSAAVSSANDHHRCFASVVYTVTFKKNKEKSIFVSGIILVLDQAVVRSENKLEAISRNKISHYVVIEI